MADTVSGLCHFKKFLQASVGEWVRWRMPQSTSDVIADRRNWYALRCVSISSSVKPSELSSVYEMEGSATGISRVLLRTCPKPTFSANLMASSSKERKCTESPLKTGGFSFHGISANDSSAGTAPLAAAPAGGRRFDVLIMEVVE